MVLAGIRGQPGYVLFALGVPALVLSIVCTAILVRLPNRYATARLRRIAAKEI
jgi:hypothetical protein